MSWELLLGLMFAVLLVLFASGLPVEIGRAHV